MSSPPLLLKKPKVEREDSDGFAVECNSGENRVALYEREEQEEALVALIEHRTKEVVLLRQRIAYYNTQLDQAERRLEETQLKLSRIRGTCKSTSSKKTLGDSRTNVKVDQKSTSSDRISEGSSENQSHSESPGQDSVKSSKNPQGDGFKDVKHRQRSSRSAIQIGEVFSQNKTRSRTCKPQLVIPAVTPKLPQPMKIDSGTKASNCFSSRGISSEQGTGEIQAKGTKRKFEKNEQKDLIPLICSCSSPRTIHCETSCLISSQHKRKLRSLVLCPTNDQLFVTSALDGVVNLWQVQARGSSANLISTTDYTSLKQRRWPEDIAWHPQGNSLFSVYSADAGDSQVAVLDLDKANVRDRVNYLEDKPHVKGIINSIMFMPWEDTCFVTGGSDHAVVLWTEKDRVNMWKSKLLHSNLHSSAVMGVAGMQQKQLVISAGADKRIIGFDLLAGRADQKHQIDSKCMSVVPNPCEFNLFMVQTGTPGRQLRLYDYRMRGTEIHEFGWKQETSESQSALINQAWSPDGLFITSGSADPVIHIFDIRYNAHKPTQSIRAHQKRVFKAVWHYAFPLLISISSDLNIGLHKVT